MVYDLNYTLNEIKKRAEKLFKKGYKEQFIVLVFKIRSPTLIEYLYYISCYTQTYSIKEIDKAIEVYKEAFRGEKLVDFKLRTDYKWKPPKTPLKTIDEVMKELDKLGKEYERKIAEKLPEKLRKMPITPEEGPVTITIIFKDKNQTFGIDITEDYYRIDREILEYLTDSLPPTSKILGYNVEPQELMLKEPEIEDYYIEEGHLIVELKHEIDKIKT